MTSQDSWSERKRQMYAGGRPNEEAREIHRRFVVGPLPRLLPIAAVLHVHGRRTGASIGVPIVVVPYGRHWYTVSMLGEQSNWVRNVRASGGEAELTHGCRRAVRLTDVPVEQRGPIIKRYLTFAIPMNGQYP